jgi:hypothetical protein
MAADLGVLFVDPEWFPVSPRGRKNDSVISGGRRKRQAHAVGPIMRECRHP